MKKLLLFIFGAIIISQFLIGCSVNKNIDFKEFYSQVIGFSENDVKLMPIEQDSILMLTNADFQKFKDKYFTPREIQIESTDKDKAVLYLQIPSPTSAVNTYIIKSINLKDNTLTINLRKPTIASVDNKSGFNGSWEWVMFVAIDKTNLSNNTKIVINKYLY